MNGGSCLDPSVSELHTLNRREHRLSHAHSLQRARRECCTLALRLSRREFRADLPRAAALAFHGSGEEHLCRCERTVITSRQIFSADEAAQLPANLIASFDGDLPTPTTFVDAKEIGKGWKTKIMITVRLVEIVPEYEMAEVAETFRRLLERGAAVADRLDEFNYVDRVVA